MASFSPAKRFRSVLFPTLGRPTRATNPLRLFFVGLIRRRWGPRMARLRLRGRRADPDGADHHVLLRLVSRPFRNLVGDAIHDLLPLSHLAEDRVAVGEVGRGDHGDEELGAIRTRAGVGHRQEALPIEPPAALELVLELIPRAAEALAERIATLDHEVGDASVKDGAVVQRSARHLLAGLRMGPLLLARGQPDEVLHRLWGVLREELHPDRPLAGVEGRVQVLAGAGRVHHPSHSCPFSFRLLVQRVRYFFCSPLALSAPASAATPFGGLSAICTFLITTGSLGLSRLSRGNWLIFTT